MAVATLSDTTQDRLTALRARFAASRERSATLFSEFNDDTSGPPALPSELTDTLARLKSTIALGDSDAESPNSGLPMLAGANNKQHR